MKQLVVTCERNSAIIKQDFNSPCQCRCYTPQEQFSRDHNFNVSIHLGCSRMDGGDWIATLYCTHINSDSAEDCKKACNFGYTDALEYAFQKSNSSHNLVVINSAIINGDASCESVEFAFKRMHCILRDTVSQAFGALSPNNSIDMYYDFQAMDNKDSAMIKRFAYDFENGEIQIDKIGNDQAWYIHMIPCEPGSVSGQFQHSESSADNTVMR